MLNLVFAQKYQLKWEEERVFEVDAPSIEEFPLGSISASELREKYVTVPDHKLYMRQEGTWRLRQGSAVFGENWDLHEFCDNGSPADDWRT